MPQYGSAVFEAWKTAKANANRWRAELQKDLLLLNKQMKRALRDVLLQNPQRPIAGREEQEDPGEFKKVRDEATKEIAAADPVDWDAIDRIQDKRDDKIIDIYRAVLIPADGEDIYPSAPRPLSFATTSSKSEARISRASIRC